MITVSVTREILEKQGVQLVRTTELTNARERTFPTEYGLQQYGRVLQARVEKVVLDGFGQLLEVYVGDAPVDVMATILGVQGG